ncbi:MAG: diphosphomevalonate decarboxylase [Endozoicomonadaceae bacterium]|nr:diphosphomevalonate decarboxylase [Endozoicomonadaceae bacterium]
MKNNAMSVAKKLLQKTVPLAPKTYTAYAPANIALCKYWGKRNTALNLPINDSLSISLGKKGTHTTVEPIEGLKDIIFLNHQPVLKTDITYHYITQHLHLFRQCFGQQAFRVISHNTIATAAGLASSASGFAALTQAIIGSYGLSLPQSSHSILARLGSGSACRSIGYGFMWWQAGTRLDGQDSFATPLDCQWPTLQVGILTITTQKKHISSREGMQHTTNTSILYPRWPQEAAKHLQAIKAAIKQQDFKTFGEQVEQNALTFHATMLASWPPLCYWTPDTLQHIQSVWRARENGVKVYLTMDAGPNLKLLFESNQVKAIKQIWPNLDIIQPFVSI